MDIGIGVDLGSGSPMNKVVQGQSSTVQDSKGAAVDFQVHRIESTEEMQEAVGIDIEASLGSGLFGASISERFSFVKNARIQTNSLFLTVSATVKLAFESIDEPELTEKASSVVNNPTVFSTRYGNMFVRGLDRGGSFVGLLRIDTRSAEEAQSISNALSGSYAVFSADTKAKFDQVIKTHDVRVDVRMWHVGGPTDLILEDSTQPSQLLAAANRFIESFQQTPEAVAFPYTVTLAPVSIAEGPLPLNEAQLQHAQTVLVHCGKNRATSLDNLNLIEHILDHESDYDWQNTPPPEVLRDVDKGLQADLDLIRDCATEAMNHPEDSKMLSEYAATKGIQYPKGVMPASLPRPKESAPPMQEFVSVPDYTSSYGLWRSDIISNEMLLHHLIVTQAPIPLPPGLNFPSGYILLQEPKAGTVVKAYSLVKLRTVYTL